MRTTLIIALLLSATAATARAQLTPEEAKARLEAKRAAREEERSKTITITQGQLDDLQTKITALQTQVEQLKAQLAAATNKSQAAQSLAVGITKDQLMDLMRRHPHEYDILSDEPVHDNGPGPQQLPDFERILLSHCMYLNVKTGNTHDAYNGVDHTTVVETANQWVEVEQIRVDIKADKVAAVARIPTRR